MNSGENSDDDDVGAGMKGVKSVTFHPSAFSQDGTRDPQQNSCHSEPTWESRESTSGYVAESGGADITDEGIKSNYYQRLIRFYAKYNPQKQHKVEEYLNAYRGEEEQLFAILAAKYGPEPVDETATANVTESRLSSEEESVMHFTGKRCQFPSCVSAAEGKTDCETPYWAGMTSLISERDLLSLLQNLSTENVELQKCFMGLFSEHPLDSWNGMTYICEAQNIASEGIIFLGHTWVGTLGSGKVLFHKQVQYHRVTLYCTEECQRKGNHERWRLSVYRTEQSPLILLRTLWDPVVIPEPLPFSRSNYSEREFHSSSESYPSIKSHSSFSEGGPKIIQPTTPLSAAITQFTKLMDVLEMKIVDRLDRLEARVENLEKRA